MKVKLKQAAHFSGKDYPIGIHDLPDSVGESWFFKAMVKDSHIEILDAVNVLPEKPVVVKPDVSKDVVLPKQASPMVPVPEVVEDEVLETEVLEEAEELHESKKPHKKKRK